MKRYRPCNILVVSYRKIRGVCGMPPWKSIIDEVSLIEGTFLLAISGGIDSMVLLEFFKRKFPDRFSVAHFNHHIRDTDIDEDHVVSYCNRNGINVVVGHGFGLKDSASQEDAARKQRWQFLEKTAMDVNASTIVTGHHQNDHIENFILQIMRGNHISSCLMTKQNTVNGFNRYKPFLDLTKEDIIGSAKFFRVEWNEDETNSDSKYLRNFVRNEIIPKMMEDRNVIKTIPKTIKSLQDILNEN